jgi:hydrogenase-4 component F
MVPWVRSLLLATALLLAQRDYKRLLAYFSIEHMALVAIGVAGGTPLAIAAALLHIVGHGLSKTVLFCGAGEILACEGTTRIADIRGLFVRTPVLAGLFAIGFAALLGLPPFSLFVSGIGLIRAGTEMGLGWATAAMLVLLLVIFVAVTVTIKASGILLGTPAQQATAGCLPAMTVAPLVAGLGVVAVPESPTGPWARCCSAQA